MGPPKYHYILQQEHLKAGGNSIVGGPIKKIETKYEWN
jgi:hypothetical protein